MIQLPNTRPPKPQRAATFGSRSSISRPSPADSERELTTRFRRRMASRTVAGGRARSARPPEPRTRPVSTAAAVAEGIHAAWYLIRDALRGRPSTSHVDRWSRASRATTGYPPCRHPATVPRYVNLCVSTVRTPLFLARASPANPSSFQCARRFSDVVVQDARIVLSAGLRNLRFLRRPGGTPASPSQRSLP